MSAVFGTLILASLLGTALSFLGIGNPTSPTPNSHQPVFNVGNIKSDPAGSSSLANIDGLLGTIGSQSGMDTQSVLGNQGLGGSSPGSQGLGGNSGFGRPNSFGNYGGGYNSYNMGSQPGMGMGMGGRNQMPWLWMMMNHLFW